MKRNISVALSLTILIASIAGTAFADDSAAVKSTKVTDVALHAGGVLVGQIVDQQQQPLAGEQVVVRFQNKPVASTTTDAKGRFVINGLRAGTHTLATVNSEGLVHLWAPHTAPPAAHLAALLVTSDEPIVRAQGKKGKDGKGGVVGGTSTLMKLVVVGLGAGGLAVALDNRTGS